MIWKLLQITILRTNSKIVGTHIFRKFFLVFLHQTHVNLLFYGELDITRMWEIEQNALSNSASHSLNSMYHFLNTDS
ncbi:hypothetical protein LIH_12205 [Leptospira interrogans serovar Hardjo-prajitno]|nr:hypothetical protein G436_2939 [Leptospira interrogans serovar Hardjo str. Norma]ALO01116.1 hypothetical protein LIH_12205 [Leptospira interrogans serovar Hardjo-prajitno]QIP63551.1 hypothetical protein LICSK_06205 [Leptospira interrogans serovar Copenhageni]